MSILAGNVPFQKSNQFGEKKPIPCEGGVGSNKVDGAFKIVYPESVNDVLPLAGGAIVRVSIKSLSPEIKPSNAIAGAISRRFSSLLDLELQNTLESLVTFRTEVNKSLYDIRKIKIVKEDDSRVKAPELYFSIYQGDDSSLEDNVGNPKVNKVCSFSYIPIVAMYSVLNNVIGISNVNDNVNAEPKDGPSSEPTFKDIIGTSGLTFEELYNKAIPLRADTSGDEDDIIDLVLELFPIFNIPEDEIIGGGGEVFGGYYTIFDGNIYVKMPDLSGMNSAGFSNDFYTEEDINLYMELISKADIKRMKFEEFKAPPQAALVDYTDEFSTDAGSDIEIEIDTVSEVSDISKAYLSVIDKTTSGSASKPLKTFDNGIELYTIPLLTKPVIGFENRSATIDAEQLGQPGYMMDIKPLNGAVLEEYFSDIVESADNKVLRDFKFIKPEELGISVFSVSNTNIFFGEKNRAEVVLSDRDSDFSVRKNDRRYNKPRSFGKLSVLAQNRPRIYDSVPSTWIESTGIKENSAEGTLIVSFSQTDLDNINISSETLNGEVDFVLYLKDSLGQIARVPGRNISFSTIEPVITEILPDGFVGGGGRLTPDSFIQMFIAGEGLAGATALKVKPDGGEEFSIALETDANKIVNTSSDNQIRLSFIAPLSLSGFTLASTTHEISVVAANGKISNALPIYISIPDEALPTRPGFEITFSEENDVFGVGFGKGAIYGIPLTTEGNDAQIKIKAKTKYFTGNGKVYAYLGVKADEAGFDAISKMSPGKYSLLLSSKDEGNNIYVAKNIEYELELSAFGDFYRLSNKRAIIKFPGSKYRGYNFSDLPNLDRAYFVLTNHSLNDNPAASDKNLFTLNNDQYGLVLIGDPATSRKGFVNPPIVKALYAKLPGTERPYSTASADGTDILDIFDHEPEPTGINAFLKISKLAVVFSGIDDGVFLGKKYKFKLGRDKLKRNLSGRITQREGKDSELIAVFKNVSTSQEGNLNVSVEKKDRRFKTTINSEKSIRQASFLIKDGFYEIDDDTGEAVVKTAVNTIHRASDIDSIGQSSFIAGNGEAITSFFPFKTMELLIKPTGSGIQIRPSDSDEFYNFFAPVTLFPNADISVNVDGKNKSVNKSSTQSDVTSLSRSVLEIKNGSLLSPGYYEESSNNDLLGFLKVDVGNPTAINFNIPEVVGISSGSGEMVYLSTLGDRKIEVTAGTDVEIEVINSKKNFVVKLGDLIIVDIKGKAERVTGKPKGTYRAKIRIPKTMAGLKVDSEGSCFKISAATTNANRLGSKFALGSQFVLDIDKKMQELLFGPLLSKIPDLNDLKDLLLKTPLKFVAFLLDKAMALGKLIGSFCDLSFHLTMELKLNLNGLQLLMIPIQVIFCIIDVICALLNPVKVSRAVIRLFECLYDLILLLPQISIPVMFLQLLLHLLELIKCLIQKILFTIIAINQIITAIVEAIKYKNWTAIKNLEEVLSQYLFSIDADLQFLEPIISILAIFLELLALTFRFPCAVEPGNGCALDGSMLAGIVAGMVSPEGDVVLPDALIPVAQVYTNKSIENASSGNNGSEPYQEPANGAKVAERTDDSNYLDSMNVQSESLRAKSGYAFNPTFAPSFTKSSMKKRPTVVKFKFNERGRNGFFRTRKVLDPLQTMDSPLKLMVLDGTDMKIKGGGKGNFISPLDGFQFMTLRNDKGSIKPLTINLGEDITYDEIPSMVILDEQAQLYYIEPEGIEFDSDNNVKSIEAKVVSFPFANKQKLSREDEEVDLTPNNPDDEEFDEVKVYDFPQLYFVDMRQAADMIQQASFTCHVNSFISNSDSGDINDTDKITDIVKEGQECVNTFISQINSVTGKVRNSMNEGIVPDLIDVDAVQGFANTFSDCLSNAGDKMCRYVVNTLNTSFRVIEDEDDTPLSDFPDTDLTEEVLEDFESNTPALTGAREYAAGLGDSAIFDLDQVANIIIIPRDSYDKIINGDLSDRLELSIISDSTGEATLVKNDDGSIVEITDEGYVFRVTSGKEGTVRLRAKVCDRTIQAVTYDGLQGELEVDSNVLVNCVDDAATSSGESDSPALGALVKVDRILTLTFERQARVAIADSTDRGTTALSDPQEFGTSLEN